MGCHSGSDAHAARTARSPNLIMMRVLLPIGIKAALDGSLDLDAVYENNRAAVLEELARDS